MHVANRMLKLLVDNGTEDASKPLMGTSASSTGKMPPMLTSVKRPKKHETHSSNGVVRLSRCCNPVPGDKIVGFVTRGRGVSVHRDDCPNAAALKQHPERIIEVFWEEDGPSGDTSFNVQIFVEALDRLNLLMDVACCPSTVPTFFPLIRIRIATAWLKCVSCSRFPIRRLSSASFQSFVRWMACLMPIA